jgi:hypothetical protein
VTGELFICADQPGLRIFFTYQVLQFWDLRCAKCSVTLPRMSQQATGKNEVDAALDAIRISIDNVRALAIAFERLMDERDRRYGEAVQALKDAVGAALTAQKETTGQAFAASEKAISKAEASQTAYNERSNEFRGQLDDQAKRLLARAEAETQFNAMSERIEELKKDVISLREYRSRAGGAEHQVEYNRTQANWVKDNTVSIIAIIVAIAEAVILFSKK